MESRRGKAVSADTTAGFAGPLGGLLGLRGAGASTQKIDPQTGRITSRAQGSFDIAQQEINARRSEALLELDQSNMLNDLPDEIKAVLGEAAEAGLLPNDVIMASGDNFLKAAGILAAQRQGSLP